MRRLIAVSCLVVAVYLASAWANVPAAQTGPLGPSPEDVLKTLQYRNGRITLGDNLATLGVSGNFVYLDNSDTQQFLTKVWQNPPGTGRTALGMLLPSDIDPLSPGGWGIVIFYENSGYVSDKDAASIDYDDLMRQMQKDIREESKKRVAQGYEPYELLGWARRPYYDAQEKKMYWAKRLRFGEGAEETLNYEIRILGRRGVLDLNMVASVEMLNAVDTNVPAVLKMVDFNPGHTYAEFDPGVDEVAAYGLAGLVAGGLLTKAGFFKGLLLLLLASKKLVGVALIGGLAALWAGVKRFMSRR